MSSESIVKSFSSVLKKRITGPLWGYIALVWISVNWQIWYVTFFVSSSDLPFNKLDYINTYFVNAVDLLVIPLLLGGLLSIVSPYIIGGVNNLNKRAQRTTQRWTPISPEEKVDLLNQVNNQESEYVKTYLDKINTISSLSNQISNLQGSLSKVTAMRDKHYQELNEALVSIQQLESVEIGYKNEVEDLKISFAGIIEANEDNSKRSKLLHNIMAEIDSSWFDEYEQLKLADGFYVIERLAEKDGNLLGTFTTFTMNTVAKPFFERLHTQGIIKYVPGDERAKIAQFTTKGAFILLKVQGDFKVDEE